MIVKLLTENHLEFLNLKGGCRGSSQSTHIKMPHCWNFYIIENPQKYPTETGNMCIFAFFRDGPVE